MPTYLGVIVKIDRDTVTLYFDQSIRDHCLRESTTPTSISEGLRHALRQCELALEIRYSPDTFSLVFHPRYGVTIDKAIGEVLAVICKDHPSFKTAIVRMN